MKLLTRDLLYALPEREREAVRALEHHIELRSRGEHDPLDLRDGEPETFLTVGHFQRCLRERGATRTGEKFAAECLTEILPRLGLIEDTGRVKKPKLSDQDRARRKKFSPVAPPTEGGQAAQPSPTRSYWWRVFRLPTLPVLRESRFGAWLESRTRSGRISTACLSALFRRQDLERPNRRRRSFAKGSAQWSFQHSGPP